jgi:hypothetical protein
VNEAQARELIPIKTAKERAAAWWKVRAAATGAKPITARFVRETLFPAASEEPENKKIRAKKILSVLEKLSRIFECLPEVSVPANRCISMRKELARGQVAP